MQLAISHGYNEIWQMVNAHNSTGTKTQAMPCLGKYGLTMWPETTASSILNKEMDIQTRSKKYNNNERKQTPKQYPMSTKLQHTKKSLSYYNFTDIIPSDPWRDQPQLCLPVFCLMQSC